MPLDADSDTNTAPNSTSNTTVADAVGNKEDSAKYAVSTTDSLMAYVKALVNAGVAVKGSVTSATSGNVFADTSLAAYPSSNFIGGTLVFVTGSLARQASLINVFTTGTGAINVVNGFTSTPGIGDEFVIVPDGVGRSLLVPTADSTGNTHAAHVVGNKADTAKAGSTADSSTSLMGYQKSIYERTGAPATDSTDTAQARSVVGHKADTAATTIGTNLSLMRYVKAVTGNVGFWTGPTSGTLALPNNTTETDVFEVTGITKPTQVIATLDLVNATTNKTIKVYEKIDGTNYRSINAEENWTTADEDGVRIEFTAQADYKVTVTNGSAEGINIPFRHSRRTVV